MEKFREKIASIRAEADAANEKAETFSQKVKELEKTNTDQEHDIISLKNQMKHLQEDLERAEEKNAQLQKLVDDEEGLKNENDAAQRRITLLEQELESSEKLYREATQKGADVKAEHFERKVQQSERIISDLEHENDELKNKIHLLQAEIDEFNASLADI